VNYNFIQKMFLLKPDNECVYDTMEQLHISAEVTENLNTNFQGRQTGQGEPAAWQARSPDLTLDLF
jgi:hypothetical protein